MKKTAPKLQLNKAKTQFFLDTLQAVISHRYEVLAKYTKSLKVAFKSELSSLQQAAIELGVDGSTLRNWILADAKTLKEEERSKLDQALSHTQKLDTLYRMREELSSIWERSAATKDELLKQLEDWCRRAEESGIEFLENFSRRLRCYA